MTDIASSGPRANRDRNITSTKQNEGSVPTFLCQIELPGDAVAVVEPGKFLAEAVIGERHERFAALAQSRRKTLDLFFGLALDEQRKRWREGKRALWHAVDAQDDLVFDSE